jgi:hypothetical protein
MLNANHDHVQTWCCVLYVAYDVDTLLCIVVDGVSTRELACCW